MKYWFLISEKINEVLKRLVRCRGGVERVSEKVAVKNSSKE